MEFKVRVVGASCLSFLTYLFFPSVGGSSETKSLAELLVIFVKWATKFRVTL